MSKTNWPYPTYPYIVYDDALDDWKKELQQIIDEALTKKWRFPERMFEGVDLDDE
jgi:hypothetical protein